MFRRKSNQPQPDAAPLPRISSVVADGVSLNGKLNGAGGVRIEGAFDGDIELDGLFVIGPTGRVTCPQLKARHVIVAGALRGDILAERVEIRSNGRVWGDVITVSMSTEEGAFLRGHIQMEDKVDLGIAAPPPAPPETGSEAQTPAAENPAKSETSKPTKADKPLAGKFKRK